MKILKVHTISPLHLTGRTAAPTTWKSWRPVISRRCRSPVALPPRRAPRRRTGSRSPRGPRPPRRRPRRRRRWAAGRATQRDKQICVWRPDWIWYVESLDFGTKIHSTTKIQQPLTIFNSHLPYPRPDFGPKWLLNDVDVFFCNMRL